MPDTSNPVGSPVIHDLTPKRHEGHSSEAERFESLAAKLVQVPKRELDEKREEQREGS